MHRRRNVYLNVSRKPSRGSDRGLTLITEPLKLSLKCKCIPCNTSIPTGAHTWQPHQSLQMVFSISTQERKAALLTWGFCVCLLVCVGMSERLRLSQGPDPFFLLSPLKKKKKRWNLHCPVFENSPQPQAGGLWQSHPTAAGNALLAGSHHLRQRGRHTVSGVALTLRHLWVFNHGAVAPSSHASGADVPCMLDKHTFDKNKYKHTSKGEREYGLQPSSRDVVLFTSAYRLFWGKKKKKKTPSNILDLQRLNEETGASFTAFHFVHPQKATCVFY